MTRVVTLGETMVALSGEVVGPLRHADHLAVGVAGAESNVAIGLARLGITVSWVGRVGDDEFGRRILRELRAEQIDLSSARIDPEAPTGLMLKEQRTTASTSVVYYRAGSAGSRLSADDLPAETIAGAELLHVTGITPALSASTREATFAAVAIARDAGTRVSFDPNHRTALWSVEEAVPVYRRLLGDAEVVLATEDEAATIIGERGAPEVLARRLAAFGPRQVVIKRGADGAVAVVDDVVMTIPARPAEVLDPVGAGDAFAAGYLAALLDGEEPAEALDLGAVLGAWAVSAHGDWAGLPRRAELDRDPGSSGNVRR